MTYRVFLRAVCKQARMRCMILNKMSLIVTRLAGKQQNRLIQSLKRNDEFVESLIGYIDEYKTVCECQGNASSLQLPALSLPH